MVGLSTLLFLVGAAGVAGFLDAIVGGGGLISTPALLVGLPASTPIPVILGTNKLMSTAGSTTSATRFARSGLLELRELVLPTILAGIGSILGCWLTFRVHATFMRPLVFTLLILVLAFTLLRPELGKHHAPRFGLAHQRFFAGLIAFVLGGYDGFFGPGTGTFLISLFVMVLGFDFLRANVLAKSVNWASNAAALILFISKGSVLWKIALPMAVANGTGSYLGTHVALKRGTRLVRALFLTIVGGLIFRLGWQMLHT